MRRSMVSMMMLFVILVLGSIVAVAQEGSEIPQVTVEITAEGFSGPEEMPEGVVQITFENTTEAPVLLFVSRLNEGVTPDDFFAVVENDPSGMGVFEVASSLGGTDAMPGMTVDITYNFVPGNYLIQSEGLEKSLSFTVADSEGEGATPPEAAYEIEMVDFAFNMPILVPAGPQLVHFQNSGTQWHMILIVRLDDDTTVQEVNSLLMSDEEGEDEPVAVWIPTSAGEQVWFTLDLEPGTYIIVCPLPDMNGSFQPHHMLGMRQTFTVE